MTVSSSESKSLWGEIFFLRRVQHPYSMYNYMYSVMYDCHYIYNSILLALAYMYIVNIHAHKQTVVQSTRQSRNTEVSCAV